MTRATSRWMTQKALRSGGAVATVAARAAADNLCWSLEPSPQTLCVVNAVWLLCIGTINQGMFDLLMGIVRWRYRVAVYVSLMRDEYSPFRMDLGSVQVGHGAP